MKYDPAKTLFVTDLDGTLLRSDGTLAEETAAAFNHMAAAGMKLTFATARSYHTAMLVAGALQPQIPLILHNGTFLADRADGRILAGNYLENLPVVRGALDAAELAPIVFSRRGGRQHFSYLKANITPGIRSFLDTHPNDPRELPVSSADALWAGDVFGVTCIDARERLAPVYERMKDVYSCLLGQDYYSGDYWLELNSPRATKAAAVLQLRGMLGCERVVVFGDGHNDISMFEAADEGYAVAGAEDALKAIATAVIGSNDENGVVRWLRENVF